MDKIGRYELRGELGRGGMATVYRAYDPTFRREVALKLLPREFLHDPSFQARFLNEAQVVAQLEHRAIVPVYDYGEENGQPYIVMRLMKGGSLADRLDKGPLSFTEAATILQQLAPALDKAHSQRILHRDLKPGNILFDEDGTAHISDFGIAKMLGNQEGLTATGMMAGTPAYMSPEQFRGDPMDGRSDLYAMGVIFFQMLTGQLPYRAETPWGVAMKHMGDPIPQLPPAPALPPIAQSLINHAMAKNPADRYPSASALAQDASRLASLPVGAPPRETPVVPPSAYDNRAATPPLSQPANEFPHTPPPPPYIPSQQTPAPPPSASPPPPRGAMPQAMAPAAPAQSRSFLLPALIGGGLVTLLLCAIVAWGGGSLLGGMMASNVTATPREDIAVVPSATPRPRSTPTVRRSPTPRRPSATPEAATPTATPSGEEPTPDPVVTQVSVYELAVGYCFNDTGNDSDVNLPVVDCAIPHDNEIFHLADYPAGPDDDFPGEEAIDSFASEQCRTGFQNFVGTDYDSSVYYFTYYQPSVETWKQDDREVVCYLFEPDVKLEGSAQGTNR